MTVLNSHFLWCQTELPSFPCLHAVVTTKKKHLYLDYNSKLVLFCNRAIAVILQESFTYKKIRISGRILTQASFASRAEIHPETQAVA